MERISRRFSSSNNHKNHELVDVALDKEEKTRANIPNAFYTNKYCKVILIGGISFFLLWFMFYREPSIGSGLALKSKTCKAPVFGKPLTQHVIVVDAGSTGSRIHIYKFNNCYNTPALEEELFEQTKPGLSSYNDPKKAADSLDVLLKIATKAIPKERQKCTPIMIKATAGLRLLGVEKSTKILDSIKNKMQTYPFKVLDNKSDGISIMDGELEGVYAWITVNYLLGNLDSNKKYKGVATLDLGGGSTQIVFEPKYLATIDTELVAPFRYELELGATKYVLYQYSYLGYGLMEARKRIKHKLLASKSFKDPVLIPCLAKDKTESFEFEGRAFTFKGTAQGLDECQKLVKSIFNFDKICNYKQCSFDGIYQPNITETFMDNDIYAFSYFYDRLEPLGLSQRYSLAQIKTVAQNVCSGNYKFFKEVPNALEELENNPNRCLDIAFIYTLLSNGYGIPDQRNINTEKKISGYETGWCLGAAVTSLGELDATCGSSDQ